MFQCVFRFQWMMVQLCDLHQDILVTFDGIVELSWFVKWFIEIECVVKRTQELKNEWEKDWTRTGNIIIFELELIVCGWKYHLQSQSHSTHFVVIIQLSSFIHYSINMSIHSSSHHITCENNIQITFHQFSLSLVYMKNNVSI